MWHLVTNKVKKDKFTYSSTPFPRLHLSGRWGRHGAERGAHIPERRWNGEVWSISAQWNFYRYSQTWTTLEEGNTSGPNDLPILICALLLHLNSFIQLALRGAKIVIPLHFDSCAVVPSVRQLCEPNSLLPRFARSACLKRSAFPRCHFNGAVGQQGRWPAPNQPITKLSRVWETAVSPSTSSCALRAGGELRSPTLRLFRCPEKPSILFTCNGSLCKTERWVMTYERTF